MLDDLVELGIEILGEVLEAVISAKRRKRKKAKALQKQEKSLKNRKRAAKDPWEYSEKADPWK